MAQNDKRALRVNAAQVDMTGVTEEVLGAYSEITINAAQVFIPEDIRALLGRYPVRMNAAGVSVVPRGCRIVNVNGQCELTDRDAPKEPTALAVNGTLILRPGALSAATGYEKIVVNGAMYAPESLQGAMPGLVINGSAKYYPDDWELVLGNLEIDESFIRGAKHGARYYVTGNVLIVRPGIDVSALIALGIRLRATGAYILDGCDAAAELLDGSCDVRIVPPGYAVAVGDVVVDWATAHKHGRKLYVIGDLFVNQDAAGLWSDFDRIIAKGCVTIPEATKREWLGLMEKFGDLVLCRGVLMRDQADLRISAALLAACEGGLSVMDCANVSIDEDISVVELRRGLHQLRDCALVRCAPAQLAAVQLIAVDCALVKGDEPDYGASDEENGAVTINAAIYAL